MSDSEPRRTRAVSADGRWEVFLSANGDGWVVRRRRPDGDYDLGWTADSGQSAEQVLAEWEREAE